MSDDNKDLEVQEENANPAETAETPVVAAETAPEAPADQESKEEVKLEVPTNPSPDDSPHDDFDWTIGKQRINR